MQYISPEISSCKSNKS